MNSPVVNPPRPQVENPPVKENTFNECINWMGRTYRKVEGTICRFDARIENGVKAHINERVANFVLNCLRGIPGVLVMLALPAEISLGIIVIYIGGLLFKPDTFSMKWHHMIQRTFCVFITIFGGISAYQLANAGLYLHAALELSLTALAGGYPLTCQSAL